MLYFLTLMTSHYRHYNPHAMVEIDSQISKQTSKTAENLKIASLDHQQNKQSCLELLRNMMVE